jgi:phosphoribosylaminoimidazole-succinocarboxamide synthase
LETDLKGAELVKRGKVRDLYKVDGKLLIVATDRISAFDVVIPTPIPHKGEVLTKLSEFWFDFTSKIIGNHAITTDITGFESLAGDKEILEGRSMIVEETNPVQAECVVRGYLSGSAWKEYRTSGSVCGIPLPPNLKESEQFESPIFTPSTKATSGHDENISFDDLVSLVGERLATRVRDASLEVYSQASRYAEEKGIIIADTKFEFGLRESESGGEAELILIDELLTPDSSRFWPKDEYTPGRSQPNFDKQFVRDYLESVSWDKSPPAPELPEDVVRKTTEKYIEAYEKLAGRGTIGQRG